MWVYIPNGTANAEKDNLVPINSSKILKGGMAGVGLGN